MNSTQKNLITTEKINKNLWIINNYRYLTVLQERLKGTTLKQLGVLLGVTQERIRQMEAKALEHIRNDQRPI